MLDGATMNGGLPPWEPDELGLPGASGISIALMALAFAGIWYAAHHLPHVTRPNVPTTFVHMVQLPKHKPPPPLPKPPPPVPVPVPKPIPHPIIHHVSPMPTKIPIPVKHVIIHHKPPPPLKKPPPPPAPPPAPAYNFQAYAAGLRAPIQHLVHVSRAMRMLKLRGTAYIEFTLTPSGQLISASLYRSSGNPLIDKAALAAVRRMHFPPFPGGQNKVFALPIEILPYANG
ncbi:MULTISPECIES: energy transducer TonB [Acidiphilium]|uniref:TonB family protein n=1 Tax=Acidiphilium iwatense TaxID=768198 RepID=A0ABS9DV31_9PROT|nr:MULTISPECIES: energy transducer TonB [Acidiphilium]MCF3945209.1 TonB family protein [Acidiphilium iwatense]